MVAQKQTVKRVQYAIVDGKVPDGGWNVNGIDTLYGGMVSSAKVAEGKATHKRTALFVPVFVGLWGLQCVAAQKKFLQRLGVAAQNGDDRALTALARIFQRIDGYTQIGCRCDPKAHCTHVDALVWFLNTELGKECVEDWRESRDNAALDDLLADFEDTEAD